MKEVSNFRRAFLIRRFVTPAAFIAAVEKVRPRSAEVSERKAKK